MSRSARWRWFLWMALLGLATWLVIFGDKPPPSVAAPTHTEARAKEFPAQSAATKVHPQTPDRIRPGQVPPAALEPLQPRDTLIASPSRARAVRDLFSAATWASSVPPPVVSNPAPLPAPPHFTFIGKKLEGEQWEVYLARNGQTFIVREGSTIDGTYRVDKVEPPALIMTQLPQAQTMTIAIGEPQ